MIEFIKRNLTLCLISMVLITISLTVMGVQKLNSHAASYQQKAYTDASKLSLNITADKKSDSAETKLINVKGEDMNSSFHSIDFIDNKTGWVIQNKNATTQGPSWILRTEDGGIHWERTLLKDMTANKLKFITKDKGWAIAESAIESNGASKVSTMRILQTLDGGKNWTTQWEKKLEPTNTKELWFQNESKGYVLVDGLLLSTSDSGNHWSPISFAAENFAPQHMNFINMNIGWVIGTTLKNNQAADEATAAERKLIVLKTTDCGKHWSKQFEKKYTNGPIGSVGIDFTDASTGWFLTSDLSTLNSELYHTSNGGVNWSKQNQIRAGRPTPTQLQFLSSKIGWIPLDVGAGPIAGGLMYTEDGGKTFNLKGIEEELGVSSNREVYFTSGQQGFAISNSINHGDYIIHTNDGGKTWSQIYPKDTPVEDISFVDNNHGFGLGMNMNSKALLTTVNGGIEWISIYSFPKNFYPSFISFTDLTHGFVLGTDDTNNEVLYKTKDGGKSWSRLENNSFNLQGASVIYFRFFDINNGMVTVRASSGLIFYKTQDGGESWQIFNQTPAKDVNALSFTSVNTGWCVSTSLKDTYSLDLSEITDSKPWQSLGLIDSNMWPYGIDFLTKNMGFLVVQQPPFKEDCLMKLLFTSDGGKTWLARQFPKDFKIDTIRNQFPLQFTDKDHGWLLSRYGLLTTKDGGNTWNWIN